MDSYGERIATLEAKVENMEDVIKGMVSDLKTLQTRWALIVGGLVVLTRIPDILSFFKPH